MDEIGTPTSCLEHEPAHKTNSRVLLAFPISLLQIWNFWSKRKENPCTTKIPEQPLNLGESMSEVPAYIEKIIKQLPNKDILLAQDLVDAGIVEDQSSLVTWRKNGTGPRYIHFSSHKILYQKSDVVDWLRSRPYGTQRSPTAITNTLAADVVKNLSSASPKVAKTK